MWNSAAAPYPLPNLEQAVAVLRGSESAPYRVADAEFVLAQALWRSRKDRRRALQIARRARDELAKAGDGYSDDVARIDRWLKRR